MAFKQNQIKAGEPIRIAFPSFDSVDKYEPTSIRYAHEYLLLENLYSPLVELEPKTGAVVAGIAESYEWKGEALEFKIRKNLVTHSGKTIGAEDVVFSLKRLIVLSGNTHGNFRDLVCPGQTLKSVSDACAGIESRDGKVILRAGARKAFLLPMLTTIDFAIIPKHAVDPITLRISDYSETSGAYFVASDDKKGNVELSVNPDHYHHSASMPQRAVLVPCDVDVRNSALRLFLDGKADHVMTYSGTKPEEVIVASREKPDLDLHLTMKIQTIALVFTPRGQKELSEAYRRFIGNQVRKAFAEIYANVVSYEKTDQFFPTFGDGGLTKEQKQQVANLYAESADDIQKPFRLGFLKSGGLEPWLGPVARELPKAQIYLEDGIPAFHEYKPSEKEPHAVIMTTDTGFKEDISLISYSLNAGYFGLNKAESEKWLASYMETSNKEERLEILRKLHFQSLSEAKLVPLVVSPYAALIRKPWKMDLSELYANNQLWLIKHL
jgi:hypothetical protein